MAAIFDFRHTQTSDSIPTSLSVLSDSESMGIAVGISLLSCIEADINDINTLNDIIHYVIYIFRCYNFHLSIHGDRVANALPCYAKGDGFAPHLRWYSRDLFLELIQSPVLRDLKWSVWYCRN